MFYEKLRLYIDQEFRKHCKATKGNLVYYEEEGASHSGIFLGEGQLIHLEEREEESLVSLTSLEGFFQNCKSSPPLYLACNQDGPISSPELGKKAIEELGKRSFFGLQFQNSHAFCEHCLKAPSREANLESLKAKAKERLGVTKWLLWDYEEEEEESPKLEEMLSFWQSLALDEKLAKEVEKEEKRMQDYFEEIQDEDLPSEVLELVKNYRDGLEDIKACYLDFKDFMELSGCQDYSYDDYQEHKEELSAIALELEENLGLEEILSQLGRRETIEKRLGNEVLGVHKSNDVARLLPSELLHFESEEAEYLFYAKFLEKQLFSYELSTKTKEEVPEKKGAIILCIDSSGSMQGAPLRKAKALALAIANRFEEEKRELHLLLFAGKGKLRECQISSSKEGKKLLSFLALHFEGGTDFEGPLRRSFAIIEEREAFQRADILMLSDGRSRLSEAFLEEVKEKKERLGFSIYSIRCGAPCIEDAFSDKVFNI